MLLGGCPEGGSGIWGRLLRDDCCGQRLLQSGRFRLLCLYHDIGGYGWRTLLRNLISVVKDGGHVLSGLVERSFICLYEIVVIFDLIIWFLLFVFAFVHFSNTKAQK